VIAVTGEVAVTAVTAVTSRHRARSEELAHSNRIFGPYGFRCRSLAGSIALVGLALRPRLPSRAEGAAALNQKCTMAMGHAAGRREPRRNLGQDRALEAAGDPEPSTFPITSP
jgi:hypothetical protein